MAEDKRSIYKRSGLGHRIGYGKHPALLVIDMQVGFTAPEKSPLAGNLDSHVAAINRLLPAARKAGAPVVFTVVGYDPQIPGNGGLWPEKAPTLLELKLGSDLVKLDPRLQRMPDELLLIKKYASAFLGTPLASTLVSRGVDTVVVTGCTTSGCVRATVIDALSHGFRPIVPEEAVGDRAREPHDANLFDIDSKYGDVVPLAEALAYLEESRR
jgi:nicotinamidase-related amidase